MPWSKPINDAKEALKKQESFSSLGANRRQSLDEETNLINLFESQRSSSSSKSPNNAKERPKVELKLQTEQSTNPAM